MTKQVIRAKGIVSKALTTFTKAIEEVNKANDILELDVAKDLKRMDEISLEVKEKYAELDNVQAEKLNKEAEIIQNKELVAKLRRFTK